MSTLGEADGETLSGGKATSFSSNCSIILKWLSLAAPIFLEYQMDCVR